MAILHMTLKKPPFCYRHPVLEMVQVFMYLILSLLEQWYSLLKTLAKKVFFQKSFRFDNFPQI